MKNQKHTPGPWKMLVNKNANKRLKGEDIKIVADSPKLKNLPWNIARPLSHRSPKEQLANAHLIAAAPELLEALELSYGFIKNNHSQEHWHKTIFDAIRKAKGE